MRTPLHHDRRTARLALIAIVTIVAVLGATACNVKPVRTTNYRRVLIVGDSLLHGSAWLEGDPQLIPELQPLLAAKGVEVRLVGRSATTPVENGWARQVKDQVASWDPDLVIAESIIPDDASGPTLQRLLLEWSALTYFATTRGADFWRIDPTAPVPGSYYDGLYGSRLPGLRFAQSVAVRRAAANRPTIVDLAPAIATCPGGRNADGLHLTIAGQQCLANQLYRLITREEPPAPPTTVPPTTTPATTSTTTTTVP